jgi:uncharacterized protein YfdQ (DUF2303 family)
MADTTLPSEPTDKSTAPRVVVPAYHHDTATGATWIHKDLVQVIAPYADEEHLGPIRAVEAFGDVESWVSYVKEYSTADGATFITWNGIGLHAVLDYHSGNLAGRQQWKATMPFVRSAEWQAWTFLANGRAHSQREAIEFLEDHALDVVEPASADLTSLLRSLRGTVTKAASTTLNEDGSTHVSFEGSAGARAQNGSADLPSHFTIGIPILKGHTGADGKGVLYRLDVRLRASVDDQARLQLRFGIPNAERALEDVYSDRVAAAKQLLGDGFSVLRAAG